MATNNQDLANTMGYLFSEVEKEAHVAEIAGITREQYNKIIENDGELPDCIKEYREKNRISQIYTEAIIESALRPPLDIPPPVIKALLESKLLNNDRAENGKFSIIKGKSDRKIIKWIVDYSGYSDELTAEIYCKYIDTPNLASTIDRYLSDSKKEEN